MKSIHPIKISHLLAPPILRLTLLVSLTFAFILLPHLHAAALPKKYIKAPTKAHATHHAKESHILQQRPDRLIVELPNRMVLVAQEIKTSPVVSVQVWVKTGSIYEQEHVGAGLSHFLEHLLAGGSTSTRSEHQSNIILGQIGAKTNAATGLNNVHYYIDTTSNHSKQAIDLLSDWMQNNLIAQNEYKRERQVIQREFEHGKGSPSRIFWKLTQQARYQVHPARHPTIGYLDEFLSVSRDEIYSFYKKMYVPNNMVFVVAGDINKQAVIDQLESLWKKIPAKTLPTVRFPIEPEIKKTISLNATASVQAPRLRLAWPGTQLAGDGDYALDLLASILGQGESSRLKKSIRDKQRYVTRIDAYNLSFSWGKGFFGIDCEIATTDRAKTDLAIAQAIKAINEQIKQIKQQGVSDEELARAKRKVLASVAYGGQSAHALANNLATNILGTSDPDYLSHYAQKVQSLTAQAIQQAAIKFLDNRRQLTLTLKPRQADEKDLPLTRPHETVDLKTISYEKIDLDNRPLLAKLKKIITQSDPQKTHPIAVGQIKKITLANGLRILVQKSSVVPAVSFQLFQLGGALLDGNNHEGFSNAASLLLTKGADDLTSEQIAQQIENLGANLIFHGGNNTTYAQAICLKNDWQTILKLLAKVALKPTFSETEWQKIKPRLLASIRRQKDSWNGELNLHFRKQFFGKNHPWANSSQGKLKVIKEATAAQLQSFYTDRLNAHNTVLAIFGDIDPEAVIAEAKVLFSQMPSTSKVVLKLPDTIAPVASVRLFKTSKPLAAVQIGLGPGVTRSDKDFAGIQVLTKIISDFPSGWLEAELRGKGPGLAYAVWCYQITGMLRGGVVVGFNTQPKTLNQALERAYRVIERAKEKGITQEDLTRAKSAVLVSEYLGKQTNSSRAMDAALGELYGTGYDDSLGFFKQVQSLDIQQINALSLQYLKNPVTVIITNMPTPTDTLPKWK